MGGVAVEGGNRGVQREDTELSDGCIRYAGLGARGGLLPCGYVHVRVNLSIFNNDSEDGKDNSRSSISH